MLFGADPKDTYPQMEEALRIFGRAWEKDVFEWRGSSTAGLRGIPGHSAYGASKFGLRGLTRSAALDLGADGIRVNSVHPGAIDTPMVASAGFERGEGKFDRVPLKRVGVPEDVAGLVLFLASDASSYITG